MMSDSQFLRTIKSYVRREGHLTEGQRRALQDILPRLEIPFEKKMLDFASIFPNQESITLEIGFGNGAALAEMAEKNPHHQFLGMEVYRPGVGTFLGQAEARDLTNVKVMVHDAVEVLQEMIPHKSLAKVCLFFPDPWPKRRHHKRRIVQPDFVQLVGQKLAPGGLFHMATDWEDYAHHMMKVMGEVCGFVNQAGAGQFAPRPEARPLTKFEGRGMRLGHGLWDLVFEKVAPGVR